MGFYFLIKLNTRGVERMIYHFIQLKSCFHAYRSNDIIKFTYDNQNEQSYIFKNQNMLSESRISSATKQFMQTLNSLSSQIISHYFQPQASPLPFKKRQHLVDLYTFVYENCNSKPSYEQKMFETFKQALLKHLIKYMNLLNESLKNNRVIQCYNLIWDSYIVYLKLLSNRVFSCLNRYYIPANDLDSLVKVGLGVFMKTFLEETNIKVFISPYAKGLDQNRSSKIINNEELLRFSQSFAIIDNTRLFRVLKEIYMMEAQSFYDKVFENHCNDQPMVYLNYICNLRYFQLVLAKKSICLTESQEKALCQLFNTRLIKKYTQVFVCHPYGFGYLLRNKRVEKLKLVCDLYEKNEGFADLKKFLYDFIIEEGNVTLLQKSKQINSEEFVNSMYEFYKGYEALISSGFSKSSQMVGSFNIAFEKIMAKFDRITQDLFKLTRTNLDIDNFDAVSDKIITIFQKMPYKDEYLARYRRSLQGKVLSNTVIYLIQKNFIQLLNKICNNEATSQLGKILQDGIQSNPRISCTNQNFNTKVLYLHLWQKNYKEQLSFNLNLNEPILSKWTDYQTQYIKLFPKHRLILLPIQTKLVLKVISLNKEMTIKCNLIQACIIFYVANSKRPINENNIILDLSLEKNYLYRFLQQFPHIITDNQQGILNFNWNFESVDHVVDLDTKVEEEKKVIKHIKQDRDIQVQFTIVRIVKRKKRVSFEQLVEELVREIKFFKPHPSMIKSSIQAMKNRQVIEQDAEGMICYKQ